MKRRLIQRKTKQNHVRDMQYGGRMEVGGDSVRSRYADRTLSPPTSILFCSVGTRSDRQSQFLSNYCVVLLCFCFFFCFIYFYLLFPSISYIDRVATTAVLHFFSLERVQKYLLVASIFLISCHHNPCYAT